MPPEFFYPCHSSHSLLFDLLPSSLQQTDSFFLLSPLLFSVLLFSCSFLLQPLYYTHFLPPYCSFTSLLVSPFLRSPALSLPSFSLSLFLLSLLLAFHSFYRLVAPFFLYLHVFPPTNFLPLFLLFFSFIYASLPSFMLPLFPCFLFLPSPSRALPSFQSP